MDKKNVLVVFVDELRQDALRCYGNDQVITPNLDRLAEDSTSYENHYCSFPLCTPSRFTFMTGLYANEHDIWNNKGSLLPGLDTWPKALKRGGWKTAGVGKMHASPTYTDFGFDEMKLSEQDGDGRFEDDYHEFLYENGKYDGIDIMDQRSEYRVHTTGDYRKSFGTKVSDLEEPYHSTSWVTEESMKILEGWEGGGNALYVSYIKPHHPFDPVKRYVDMYDGVDIKPLHGYTPDVPEWDYAYNQGYFDNRTLDEEVLKKMTLYYYANLTHIDEGLGRMVDLLKKKGLYDDTMIIFTADHGDYMGFHHMALKANHMYDPVMRIPLVIKHVGEKSARVVDTLSDNTETPIEILREMGLPSELNSFSDTLEDEREYVLGIFRRFENGKCYNDYMVRGKRYKLLLMGSFGNIAFFDMENDPEELHDLSKEEKYQGEIMKMKMWLSDMLIFRRPSKTYHDEDTPVACKDKATTDKQHRKLEEYFKDVLKNN